LTGIKAAAFLCREGEVSDVEAKALAKPAMEALIEAQRTPGHPNHANSWPRELFTDMSRALCNGMVGLGLAGEAAAFAASIYEFAKSRKPMLAKQGDELLDQIARVVQRNVGFMPDAEADALELNLMRYRYLPDRAAPWERRKFGQAWMTKSFARKAIPYIRNQTARMTVLSRCDLEWLPTDDIVISMVSDPNPARSRRFTSATPAKLMEIVDGLLRHPCNSVRDPLVSLRSCPAYEDFARDQDLLRALLDMSMFDSEGEIYDTAVDGLRRIYRALPPEKSCVFMNALLSEAIRQIRTAPTSNVARMAESVLRHVTEDMDIAQVRRLLFALAKTLRSKGVGFPVVNASGAVFLGETEEGFEGLRMKKLAIQRILSAFIEAGIFGLNSLPRIALDPRMQIVNATLERDPERLAELTDYGSFVKTAKAFGIKVQIPQARRARVAAKPPRRVRPEAG
jgi:hypothetical protein